MARTVPLLLRTLRGTSRRQSGVAAVEVAVLLQLLPAPAAV
jgi:Flp pilus assembly protein TadG